MSVKTIIIILMIGLLAFIIKTINDAGEFKKLTPHFNGNCIAVAGTIGAEDITILKNGTALISSDDRSKTLAGNPVQGNLFAYNLTQDSPQLINLTSKLEFEFHPHGISIFENEKGRAWLTVVNHTNQGHTIEIFEFDNNSLSHLRTLTDPMLVSPNDLVMINESQFYVTNDHGSSSEWGKTLEEYLQLAKSNIVFYDGQEFSIAAQGLAYANGINKSKDNKILYVAETVGKKLSLFLRDSENNEITHQQSINLNSGVDNIEIDNEGNIWIGSHPKLLTFTRHAKNVEILSPSQVFRLSKGWDNEYEVDEVYLELGENLSGASVAAVYGSNMLIGPVLDDHFLHCILNQ